MFCVLGLCLISSFKCLQYCTGILFTNMFYIALKSGAGFKCLAWYCYCRLINGACLSFWLVGILTAYELLVEAFNFYCFIKSYLQGLLHLYVYMHRYYSLNANQSLVIIYLLREYFESWAGTIKKEFSSLLLDIASWWRSFAGPM